MVTIFVPPSALAQIISVSEKGAQVHIWYPSFYVCHPENTSLDSRALMASGAGVHRFSGTGAKK